MQTKLKIYDFSKVFRPFRKVELNTEVKALQDRVTFLERSNNAYKGIFKKNKMTLKSLALLIFIASCKPETKVKEKPTMTKAELIDAIESGSKLTKADAG